MSYKLGDDWAVSHNQRFDFEADKPIKIGRSVITPEGGSGILLRNDTGLPSVKGEVITTSGVSDNGYVICPSNVPKAIGVVYEDGVAPGKEVIIITKDRCQVLLEDGTSATRDYWVKVSDNDSGRADASAQFPPGGTIVALEDHNSEIGHAIENVTAGTDKLCWIIVHFN